MGRLGTVQVARVDSRHLLLRVDYGITVGSVDLRLATQVRDVSGDCVGAGSLNVAAGTSAHVLMLIASPSLPVGLDWTGPPDRGESRLQRPVQSRGRLLRQAGGHV